MRTYKEFRPTGFDAAGAFLPDRQNWLVLPVARNRDSGAMAESNFAAALALMGGERDGVEIHRFGHWANGWFEVILVDPADSAIAAAAAKIEERLDNYPILDEDDFSAREHNATCDYWYGDSQSSLGERIRLCAENDLSIFAARTNRNRGIPESIYDRVSTLANE